MKDVVSFTDFAKLDLRVGEIISATEVFGSDKLLELRVSFGEEIGQRMIYAGIKKWYSAEVIVGKKLIFVVNLAPKTFKIFDKNPSSNSGTLQSSASPAGFKEYTSEGMLMAAGDGEAVLYAFDKDLTPGTNVH